MLMFFGCMPRLSPKVKTDQGLGFLGFPPVRNAFRNPRSSELSAIKKFFFETSALFAAELPRKLFLTIGNGDDLTRCHPKLRSSAAPDCSQPAISKTIKRYQKRIAAASPIVYSALERSSD
jgi:hypothetical protein